MKIHTLLPLYTLLAIALFGCNLPATDDDNKEEEIVEDPIYASLEVSAPGEGEGGSISMGQASCSNDADTGFFQGTFSGNNNEVLSIKIKGFSTSESTYTCTQASDNTEGSIGNKYDGCSIELVLPDPETSTNTYNMHREEESAKAFTYTGTCTISTTYTDPQVEGSIACDGLIQTALQGAARNPIDQEVTASILSGSTFECEI